MFLGSNGDYVVIIGSCGISLGIVVTYGGVIHDFQMYKRLCGDRWKL